jgi:hypothetical protein
LKTTMTLLPTSINRAAVSYGHHHVSEHKFEIQRKSALWFLSTWQKMYGLSVNELAISKMLPSVHHFREVTLQYSSFICDISVSPLTSQ